MGLDIYLHTAEEARTNAAHEKASEALYTEGPDGKTPRAKMSEEEYAAWRDLHGSYARHGNPPSEKFPEHYWNRRYLRSSYNAGGFNSAVPTMLGSDEGDLYWIFGPMEREWDGDEGVLAPADIDKLRASKARALDVAERLRISDRLRVITVDHNAFIGIQKTTEDDALTLYREVVANGRIEPDSWWSNRDMEVFGTDGVSVLAALPGVGFGSMPGVHLIYRQDSEGFDFYVQAAEIAAEFCDEAIALIERDGSCEMTWSG